MHAWLDALTNSGLGQWVLLSPLGYPVLLTFHALGLSIVVGLLVVIDLRILGVARDVPLPAFKDFYVLVWIGFLVNAISGAVIFTSDAAKYYYSTAFRLKLLCIALAFVVLALLKKSPLLAASGAQQASAAPREKALAVLSLLCWLGAIVAGRLIAYGD